MNQLPILISYAYQSSIDWARLRSVADDIDLLVDSGAFTAFKRGKPVDRGAYQNWLERLNIPCRYFQLDVIGDNQRTFENLKAMYADGFSPLPIFTRGENPDRLDEYYALSDFIALGGVQMKSDNSAGYIKMFMRINKNRPVHWLGFAEQNLLLAFRPTSADASNWASTFMWGNIMLWVRGKWLRIDRTNWTRYTSLIETLGFDAGILADPIAWSNTLVGNGGFAQKVTAASYLNYVDQMKKRTGVQIYLVLTDKREFELLYEIFKRRNPK